MKPVLAAAAAFAAQSLLPKPHAALPRVAAIVACGLVVDAAMLILLRLPPEERQMSRQMLRRLSRRLGRGA
jgi:hypothetical protein